MGANRGTEGNLYRQVVAHKWSVLFVALVAAVSSFVVSRQQQPVYESSARVLVEPMVRPMTEEPPRPNLNTEGEIATSLPVAELVRQKARLERTAKQVLDDLSIEADSESAILTFSYRHEDPLEATRLAQTFAVVYVDERERQAAEILAAARSTAKGEIKILRRRVAALNTRIQRTVDKARRAALESRANLLNVLLVQKELAELALLQETVVARIVEDAPEPRAPVFPNPRLDAALGLILGLLLGSAQAAVRGRISGRIWSVEHLENVLLAPVLGTVPRVATRRGSAFPTIADRGGSAQLTESMRFLRASVEATAAVNDVKTILITSAADKEGKTTVAVNLAMILAKGGRQVVLISGHLRDPALDVKLSLDDRPGLAQALDEGTTVWASTVLTVHDGLHVLPSGGVVETPAEMLGSTRMRDLLLEVRRNVDLVIIDSAPISDLADSVALAPLVDGVILVANMERTNTSAVALARQRLDRVGARVLGGILGNVDPRKVRSRSYFETRESVSLGTRTISRMGSDY